MKHLVILDDEKGVADRYKERLDRIDCVHHQFDVLVLDQGELLSAVQGLGKRRGQLHRTGDLPDDDNPLDRADLLLIDYRLAHLQDPAFLTGEEVAYLARCFSRCGFIVALNQFPEVDFDLTLQGHLGSFADLNINAKVLDNEGLWFEGKQQERRWPEFRPWYWPLVPNACEKAGRRVGELLDEGVDQPVLGFLGFVDEPAAVFTRADVELLSASEDLDHLGEVTFRGFVTESGHGLRSGDLPGDGRPLSDEVVARVAAARLAKWLERRVLAGQDALVDAPHLAERYPSLLMGDAGDLDDWDACATFGTPPLAPAVLNEHEFTRHAWLSRRAWIGRSLALDSRVAEVRDPWSFEPPEWVFCEDVSRFVLREEAVEFSVDLPAPSSRRFVRRLRGGPLSINYSPAVRFAL